MIVLLVLLSLPVLFLGAVFTNSATAGVGLIAAACYLGILARIAQAADHRDQLISALKKLTPTAVDPVNPHPPAYREPGANEIRCRKCGHITTTGPAACPLCLAPYR
jgi:hypothetical protein